MVFSSISSLATVCLGRGEATVGHAVASLLAGSVDGTLMLYYYFGHSDHGCSVGEGTTTSLNFTEQPILP